MALKTDIQSALSQIRDQHSFFQVLLNRTLNWPITDAHDIEEIAFRWSWEDLRAADLNPQQVESRIWQVQPLSQNQPWGIFVLEFQNPDALVPKRGLAGVLRKVLRGLVASTRKAAGLPSWKREHLLFICTYDWQHFRFAYFRSKPDDPQASRLATFGWDLETSPRTVCEFNLPALVWPEDPSDSDAWISAWAKAFDKEPLTRDFFKRFDIALGAIKSDLEEHQALSPADAYSQAQLLLERLIFLYFMQNRGWLNQDQHYLRDKLEEHTAKPAAFTYYSEFLDKLFWTLSSAPSEGGRFPGIPFLNGGLFDDDEFRPGTTRKANPLLKVRNGAFQQVFRDLLEAFNFTVTEDTPLNQEVAVDPEMLGKVFESIVLHAEQDDPEANAPDKRKSTGSYYTPRIVVHFICREVLYQYLLAHLPGEGWGQRLKILLGMDVSDGVNEAEMKILRETVTAQQAAEALNLVRPLRCCDPAVGSGAFPVGLMHELVNLRRILEAAANGYVDPARGEGSMWVHETKADIVQNCLFGVDIQQQAIEICRLRLWLSLVVDYDLGLDPFSAERSQFIRAIERISQLPNLEMNFHRGDSLHDYVSGVPVVIWPDRPRSHAAEFSAIAKLGERLHSAKKAETKKNLRLDILAKRLDLSHRILEEEIRVLRTTDSALDSLFGLSESAAEKRKRNEQEMERLEEALKKVENDRAELDRLRNRAYDSQFYPKLRKLEGADFDSPFNFAWYIDFPNVFGTNGGGFDIIVGNPPFVTARNPKRRELWRQRWPRVCVGTYQLVCPFFELGYGLLRPGTQLGFIVSNAFAKRGFGKALVEKFFPTIDLRKIVDCSGLMFPGHGTPTCLVFGQNNPPAKGTSIRIAAILPGGGDLRTPPEDSLLWHTLEANHDKPGYLDSRVVVADHPRDEMTRWPWNFDASTKPTIEALESNNCRLSKFVRSFGSMFDTHKDDVFMVTGDNLRRHHIETAFVTPFAIGDQVRNWGLIESGFVLRPYDTRWRLEKEDKNSTLFKYLRLFRRELGGRATFGGGTYDQVGEPWYRYHQMSVEKITAPVCVVYPEISTHAHFVVQKPGTLFTQTAPLILLNVPGEGGSLLTAAVFNSSAALFWLKPVCFSKREAEETESDTYYEFAGGKVQQLPVPEPVAAALSGQANTQSSRLIDFSQACWERGQQLPSLSLKKLFNKPGEAYDKWNSSLPGYVVPNHALSVPFESTEALRECLCTTQEIRERLRGEMIALQEEMDWLVYAAYGLLPQDHRAVGLDSSPAGDALKRATLSLERERRAFCIWGQAEGDYSRAVDLIPSDWPQWRKQLWEARLAAIRDNEHIRRIEQPVFKRRWDEQWKVKNQWRCGSIAYAAEFVDAFEWWLREKAEWWLENKKDGGPVELDDWALALWKAPRVQAAWDVAAENYALLKAETNSEPNSGISTVPASFPDFRKAFKRIVDEETVPEKIPWAIAYELLEKKTSVPAKVKKVRGKLNVPRERFHQRGRTTYLWAGLQFQK